MSGLFHALLGLYSQTDVPQQSFEFFAQHTCIFLKGALQDKAERLYIFCSGGSASLTKSSLETSLIELIKVSSESQFVTEVCPHLANFSSDLESVQRLSSFLLNNFPDDKDFKISQSSFEEWISKSEISQKICHLAFSCIFYQEAPPTSSVLSEFKTSPLVPTKTTHPLIRERFSSQLLDHSSLTLLSNFIPTDLRGQLYPLFSSFRHGESYSMFCKQLVGCQGPTLIVVKDTNGYLFGAFAAENWQFGPKFKGECHVHCIIPY